jgi:hypothetical protein
MATREIKIKYRANKIIFETRKFNLKEVIKEVMMAMPFCTLMKLFDQETEDCDNNQCWSNDYFVEMVMKYINRHYVLGGELTEDNMIYEKWVNWETFKSSIHQCYSFWMKADDYLFWRTYTHPKLGKIKLRLHPDKSKDEIYRAVDFQSTEKELERMRMKEKRLRTYQTIAGRNSIFLKSDQQWIGTTETKLLGGQ